MSLVCGESDWRWSERKNIKTIGLPIMFVPFIRQVEINYVDGYA